MSGGGGDHHILDPLFENEILEKEKETITSFFPYNNQVVIAKFKEVFIAPRDIEAIYKTIDEIDSIISTELLKKEIQTKSVELEKFEQELQQHKEEIDQLKPVWLNELKTLIAKINENFS